MGDSIPTHLSSKSKWSTLNKQWYIPKSTWTESSALQHQKMLLSKPSQTGAKVTSTSSWPSRFSTTPNRDGTVSSSRWIRYSSSKPCTWTCRICQIKICLKWHSAPLYGGKLSRQKYSRLARSSASSILMMNNSQQWSKSTLSRTMRPQ